MWECRYRLALSTPSEWSRKPKGLPYTARCFKKETAFVADGMLGSFIFPSPDPIPLPAPVWLFKLLHGTLLSLHFAVVQWVLGWLLIGLLWNLWGRSRNDATMVAASTRIAASLPILMTYLINFGIPPLLFTQVLYGNFLYTSSVLIGAWWISIVFLVILTYSTLYAGNARSEQARAWWGFGLLALIAAVAVAKIYSTTMTLMLRPDVWVEMFRANTHGTGLPSHDPTLIPRWLFMLAGALTMGGLALIVTGVRQKQSVLEKRFLVFNGGRLAAVGAALQAAAALRVVHTQPIAVLEKLKENAFYHALPSVWIGLAAAVVVLGLLAMARREKVSGVLATAAATAGLLLTATMVIYRDGIRDFTLLVNGGFDVWSMKVVANWPVVSIFLGTFVAGLLAVGWMISIARKATPSKQATALPGEGTP